MVKTVICIHGGGWTHGTPEENEKICKYLEKDYNIFNIKYSLIPKGTIWDAQKDVDKAVRNIGGDNVSLLGISAGGTMACMCSVRVKSLILFNPVLNLRWFLNQHPERLDYCGVSIKNLSPIENINKSEPPTLILQGNVDKVVLLEHAKKYKEKMEQNMNTCKLRIFNGDHGFFLNSTRFFNESMYEVCSFLAVR